jgi:hypothetical protein
MLFALFLDILENALMAMIFLGGNVAVTSRTHQKRSKFEIGDDVV